MGSVAAGLLRLLRCAGCQASGLLDQGEELACLACGRRFPVQAGVPVMVSDAVAVRGPLLDPTVADAVMQRLGIPADAWQRLRVRQASGARVAAPASPELARADGRVLHGIAGVSHAAADVPTEGRLECAWLGDHGPRAWPPGVTALFNVRFRNASRCTMPATGEGRVTVAATWSGEAGESVRTNLPADLAPGQAILWTVKVQTPATPGRYALSLRPVQEAVRWMEPVYGPLAIQVTPDARFEPPSHWLLEGQGPRDAEGDGQRAAILCQQWIDRLGLARPRLLLLDAAVAGLTASGCDAVRAGTDLLALQLGKLAPGGAMPSFCAAMTGLPLADGAFDAVIGTGLLRYAAEPVRLLRGLRRHLRPGGFIALVSEPAGHVWPGTAPREMVAEWRHGLNPQSFSLQEYATLFRQAGLQAADLVVDGPSLKARLISEPAAVL